MPVTRVSGVADLPILGDSSNLAFGDCFGARLTRMVGIVELVGEIALTSFFGCRWDGAGAIFTFVVECFEAGAPQIRLV